MPYRLHVTTGPSLDLSTHHLVSVNDEDHPVEVRSSHFRGRITVRVRDYPGSASRPPSSSLYFDGKRSTFSIQCQGQYGDLEHPEHLTADDLMFGIVLREPLTQTPPLGLALIERTMRFFWPIMECNLRDSSPWILSPAFATMSRIRMDRLDEPSSAQYFRQSEERSAQMLPPWPGITPDAETENAIAAPRISLSGSSPPTRSRTSSASGRYDLLKPTWPPIVSRLSLSPRSSIAPEIKNDPKLRKKHFSSVQVRKDTRIDPADTITTIFHNSFIDFRDLTLTVPGLPFRIELGKYMVDRPAQYVCRDREDKVFWAVVFTILRDE
ncbi:hypothetical protein RhiLY_04529 [Ceratobasidium sp. AG-Ba]|nr:hypothetical protein RhiLY_04529 [Ceratobasidium sp. AG-Ba]